MRNANRHAETHCRLLGAFSLRIIVHPYSAPPARKNRIAANISGGTSCTPTRIAKYVDPQTK
jgi:hypothetical protein